jgi:peptidoglycan hydrolase-like protein with peptidoglycan-binding domain
MTTFEQLIAAGNWGLDLPIAVARPKNAFPLTPYDLAARLFAVPLRRMTAATFGLAKAGLAAGANGRDRFIQQSLAVLGFLGGPPDGVFGAGTTAAVKAFQKSCGLSQTGVVDGKVYEKLCEAVEEHGETKNDATTPRTGDLVDLPPEVRSKGTGALVSGGAVAGGGAVAAGVTSGIIDETGDGTAAATTTGTATETATGIAAGAPEPSAAPVAPTPTPDAAPVTATTPPPAQTGAAPTAPAQTTIAPTDGATATPPPLKPVTTPAAPPPNVAVTETPAPTPMIDIFGVPVSKGTLAAGAAAGLFIVATILFALARRRTY